MKTIVMTHGAFCGGWAFDGFRKAFEASGWQVIAQDLRGHGVDAAPSATAGVSMAEYAKDLADLCATLDRPPVLLGHSMGGLVAQMAARRVKLEALVLLAPSAPWGVAGSSLEEAASAVAIQMMDPFGTSAVEPDRTVMTTYALDRLADEERQRILSRLRPESAMAMRQTLSWWMDPFMTTSVGPGPLGVRALAIAGERDMVHPASTVRQTAARIGAAFETAPGMSHWLMDGPGSDAVAAQVLEWLALEARAAA
ncbi:alpha/beta hydrolase [Phenylobacterium immobile]|uniref:alpha/beta fold hydrolase n=1 Tax=Phenylobacterium immobile TaxID=21 RepID=UPI000A54A442